MRKSGLMLLIAVVAMLLVPAGAFAGNSQVPGHQKHKYDADNNGIPDIGVVVTGNYYSLYAYDANGDYYWDLGDGRVQSSAESVDSVAALDQATLTQCDYQVHYRGTFDNDPFQDSGWITNNIHCHGYDGNSTFNYQIVHQSDPRYRGNPDQAIWGTWEYHVNTQSGVGNLARPVNHVGD